MGRILVEALEFQAAIRTTCGQLGYHARALEAGTTIFMENQIADKMYQIVSGIVRLSKGLQDGRRQVLGFLFAGDFFVPSGFVVGINKNATCTAEALTDMQIISLPLRNLDALLTDQPKFASDLLLATERSLIQAQQQMLRLGRMSATERVTWFLLMMKEQQDDDGDASIHLPMSRIDIADYLGIRSETISRVLRWLRDHRMITVSDRATITIIDSASMCHVSGGFYPSRL
ncbi:Crp/Fnr family transcriptional regulator [Acidiphilium cryptum]|uniref:Putative transcriptional regulator, Crp/Fnr family n=1 Tax=Acidiphilium cryptum (strain JF-5) TaxID=349163 RepID=A5FTA3_ACICJ|nr:cyclic nucleotide-binding domain-containing protein [Acidiphilium cryptum]ABQ28835.1 putative transcriptional regulator, Crp/Fnr family [Acidiphilium cryptum JF-5]